MGRSDLNYYNYSPFTFDIVNSFGAVPDMQTTLFEPRQRRPRPSPPAAPVVTGRPPIQPVMPAGVACACGGGCPRCASAGAANATMPIQRKPRIGVPGDRFEREADDLADQVMRMTQPPPFDSASCGQGFARGVEPVDLIQRAAAENNDTTPDSELAMRVASQAGSPLPAGLRAYFAPRFGRNFDDVLIHTGPQADAAASSVQARAFTVGHHVVFADHQYQPATDDGRRLLAHELSHVVQQSGESPLGHGAALPGLQRQAVPAQARRPALMQGTPARGNCRLRFGAFAWAIIPGGGSFGACFRVQIVFFPGRIEVIRGGTGIYSPALGARWVPDTRPIALVQTVASRSGGFGERPAVDQVPGDTDPYYGARWDSSSGAWADEPTMTQGGCPSLPEAVASSGYAGGSRFSRPGSYGAVINDSPMTNVGERKDFQTTAVVMHSAEPLGSLTWSIRHEGTRAVVDSVTCHERPQPNVPFGTPGHDEMLGNFYQSSPHWVVDGFALNSSNLPAGAAAILDDVIRRMAGGRPHTVVVSGAATADESDPPALSRARADSVVSYLTSHGVTPGALRVEAYGATAARQPFGSPGADVANRRVQLTVTE